MRGEPIVDEFRYVAGLVAQQLQCANALAHLDFVQHAAEMLHAAPIDAPRSVHIYPGPSAALENSRNFLETAVRSLSMHDHAVAPDEVESFVGPRNVLERAFEDIRIVESELAQEGACGGNIFGAEIAGRHVSGAVHQHEQCTPAVPTCSIEAVFALEQLLRVQPVLFESHLEGLDELEHFRARIERESIAENLLVTLLASEIRHVARPDYVI